jgi:hypothetical protein
MSAFHNLMIGISLGAALAATAMAGTRNISSGDSEHRPHPATGKHASPLIAKVRRATERFKDINVAIADGWVQATACVSGPESGAMGVHFVKPERIGDGVLRADQPEALIYEPGPEGKLRLVGVEFIELAEVWDAQPGGQPVLDGHLLHLVGAPNRYDLPAFYELHVWAWQGNPSGSFADWNSLVTCERQSAQ